MLEWKSRRVDVNLHRVIQGKRFLFLVSIASPKTWQNVGPRAFSIYSVSNESFSPP